MELIDLVGEHLLDGVDFENKLKDSYKDAQVMRFRLDGIVYGVVENPQDGYRSSMKEIYTSSNIPIINCFPPVRVLALYGIGDEFEDNSDILTMFLMENGKEVINVGTKRVDSYYPCFIANFNPEVMNLEEGEDDGI